LRWAPAILLLEDVDLDRDPGVLSVAPNDLPATLQLQPRKP
jgi:hypothetical protein